MNARKEAVVSIILPNKTIQSTLCIQQKSNSLILYCTERTVEVVISQIPWSQSEFESLSASLKLFQCYTRLRELTPGILQGSAHHTCHNVKVNFLKNLLSLEPDFILVLIQSKPYQRQFSDGAREFRENEHLSFFHTISVNCK